MLTFSNMTSRKLVFRFYLIFENVAAFTLQIRLPRFQLGNGPATCQTNVLINLLLDIPAIYLPSGYMHICYLGFSDV